ncbi:MAG: hypothetical protein MUQ30_20515 [Anaerolineae bacterium]|nr:hypothetical protein [Anaerolineae bacterium]
MKLWGVGVVGLLLGLVAGLIMTWFVVPLEYYDTYPPMLDASYRHEWIRMTVWVYGLDGDWERTEARLLNLESSEIRVVAADVLEQATATGQPVEVLERLAAFAAAYGVSTPGVAIYGQGDAGPVAPAAGTPVAGAESAQATPTLAPVIPSLTLTPVPTVTPSLTPTPPVSETSAIRIISQTLTCATEPSIAVSLELSRTIEVRGREQQEIVGLPMREIWLLWDDGADRAFTGFRPDLGLGYADFVVIPGRSYNLYVDSPYGRPVLAVQVEPCPPDEGTGWVSRYLVLRDETEARAVSDTLTVTPTLTGTGVPAATVLPTATLVLTQTVTRVP